MRVVYHLTFVQITHKMASGLLGLFFALEGFLQSLEKYPIEFLDILLHLCFLVMPLEALDQISRGNFSWELAIQLPKQFLQLVQDTILRFGMHFLIVFPLIDSLAEFGGHVEGL